MQHIRKQLQHLVLILSSLFALASYAASGAGTGSTIIFVCEHGSAKSLVAAELFNRLAQQRGMSVRAISRAASVQTVDTAVPSVLIKKMSGDGFSVDNFQPQAVIASEVAGALRVVIVNYDAPVEAANGAPVEHWNVGPGVTTDYEAAKTEISRRIDALADSLTRETKPK